VINDMIMDEEILCPHCGKVVGTQRGFMHLYMPNDIRCPHCGKVAIRTNQPRF